jgi:hypothetical protein
MNMLVRHSLKSMRSFSRVFITLSATSGGPNRKALLLEREEHRCGRITAMIQCPPRRKKDFSSTSMHALTLDEQERDAR